MVTISHPTLYFSVIKSAATLLQWIEKTLSSKWTTTCFSIPSSSQIRENWEKLDQSSIWRLKWWCTSCLLGKLLQSLIFIKIQDITTGVLSLVSTAEERRYIVWGEPTRLACVVILKKNNLMMMLCFQACLGSLLYLSTTLHHQNSLDHCLSFDLQYQYIMLLF